jgi:hypothetical protein
MGTHVIHGTCPRCGWVPGTIQRVLTREERQALLDRGYTLDTDVHGRDIAHAAGRTDFNQALTEYHWAVCVRPTWHARVLSNS